MNKIAIRLIQRKNLPKNVVLIFTLIRNGESIKVRRNIPKDELKILDI